MGKILAIVTQKGGVGKTTTTNALAAALSHKGYRVLCVDLDPQGNLTFSMGADNEMRATIYHVLKGEIRSTFAIQHTPITDIIPSSGLLSKLELEFTGSRRQFLLKEALAPILSHDLYDYILVDTPPSLGILTANALIAGDFVIIPAWTDAYSLQGLVQVSETISFVQMNDNPNLQTLGVLLTKHDTVSKLSKTLTETAQMICDSYKIPLLNTRIRACVDLPMAQSYQYNIIERSPKSNAAKDYLSLAGELLERGV